MSFENLFQHLLAGKIARDHPITFFDIGSRGGFQDDLLPIASAVNAVGFEPEPSEFADLSVQSVQPWLTSRHLPFGISESGGAQTLNIPRDPQSASLMRHNESIGIRFDKRQFFDIAGTTEIDTRTLSDSLKQTELPSIDYLKIDIEGPELAVIKSSQRVRDNLLALKVEVSFVEFRHGQPLAYQVDEFMSNQGFILMDLIGPAHWRRQGYVVHPYSSSETPSYSKGQIMQGDYLYFRNPETLGTEPETYIKLALISMALGYFDNALMVLEHDIPRRYLSDRYATTVLDMVGPASKKYGRRVFRSALYRQFRGLMPLLRYARYALKN